jgi:hypothetical protein
MGNEDLIEIGVVSSQILQVSHPAIVIQDETYQVEITAITPSVIKSINESKYGIILYKSPLYPTPYVKPKDIPYPEARICFLRKKSFHNTPLKIDDKFEEFYNNEL